MVRINIKKIGINGEGIGYKDRMPVFVEGALKDEVVDVTFIKNFPTYKVAAINKIIKESDKRVKPYCKYTKECKACPLMCEERSEQLIDKRELLIEALHKYARIDKKLVRNIHAGEAIHYRNECKLPIKEINNELVTGMYKPNSNHFIPIDECVIHDKELERIRKEILVVLNNHNLKVYDKRNKRGLRYLVLRYISSAELTLVIGEKTKLGKEVINDLSNIEGLVSISESINTTKNEPTIFGSNTKLLWGEKSIPLDINDLSLSLSPAAFFQLNTEMAKELYDLTISKIDKCETLVEAYAGIGAMSLLAHKKAKQIYAIENNKDAIKDGKLNAANNNIKNVEFVLDDASHGLYKIARTNYIDTLLVDPPRSGLDKKMVDAITHILPNKIIYVSCNPATLAKNLNILKKYYRIRTIIPFDLFPNTALVESITVLTFHGE